MKSLKKYLVTIEYSGCEEVEIEAYNKKQAKELANEYYFDGGCAKVVDVEEIKE